MRQPTRGHSHPTDSYETIPFDDGEIREYRVYHRIFKRDLWMVGTRLNEHHTLAPS